MDQVVRARELARVLLTGLPERARHVEGVAAAAGHAAGALGLNLATLTAAAWLHDIGYAPSVAVTGFHPLDGARYLRDNGVGADVVNLVAHHSHAMLEAEERELGHVLLAEFPFDESLPHDVLCFCDMTTGPNGQSMGVEARLAEIKSRYGPEDVVTRFITKAEPEIAATVHQVERRLAAQSR